MMIPEKYYDKRKVGSWWLVVITLCASFVAQAATSVTATIDGDKVVIPAPTGFIEVRDMSPQARELAVGSTPDVSRLLGVFVPRSERKTIQRGLKPSFYRYMLVQVPKGPGAAQLSRSKFSQVVVEVKKQQRDILGSVGHDVRGHLDDFSSELNKKYKTGLELDIGEAVALGAYLDRPDALGVAQLNKYQYRDQRGGRSLTVVAGTNLVRAGDKLLYALVYSTFKGPQDVEWVRDTSRAWANSIIEANPSRPVASRDTGTRNSIYWVGVVIVASLILGLLSRVSRGG